MMLSGLSGVPSFVSIRAGIQYPVLFAVPPEQVELPVVSMLALVEV